jgi:hypothetical protein
MESVTMEKDVVPAKMAIKYVNEKKLISQPPKTLILHSKLEKCADFY